MRRSFPKKDCNNDRLLSTCRMLVASKEYMFDLISFLCFYPEHRWMTHVQEASLLHVWFATNPKSIALAAAKAIQVYFLKTSSTQINIVDSFLKCPLNTQQMKVVTSFCLGQ